MSTNVWSGGFCGSSTMELLYLVFGWLFLLQTVRGQVSLLNCPPPFPDMEKFFQRTLQIQRKLQEFNQFKAEAATVENCTYSPSVMSKLDGFNANRCVTVEPLELECPVPTTTEEPTTIAPTTRTTTGLPPVVPVITHTPHRTSTISSTLRTTKVSVTQSSSTTPAVVVGPIVTQDIGRTSSPTELPTSTLDSLPVGYVVQKPDDLTIVGIAIGAGVLAVIVIAAALLICRRHLHAYDGAVESQVKHEKAQRQRSDCQPISSISQSDMFEDGDRSSKGTPASIRYSRGCVTNGRKWRPEYDDPSEDGSEKSVSSNGKYILLLDDNSSSAYGLSFHYNTLRTIDYPHALTMGGFGESSTDMTLPRRVREKLSQNQDMPVNLVTGVAETQFTTDPTTLSNSKVELYLNDPKYEAQPDVIVHNGHSFDTVVPVANGRIPNGTVKQTDDVDRHSLGTIDQADGVLDPAYSPDGVSNPGFEADDDDQAITAWKSMVTEENDTLTKTKGDPENFDSLVNNKNAHLFETEQPKPPPSIVKEDVLEPPDEFRDTSKGPYVAVVAVVQPSVQPKKSAGLSWLHDNHSGSGGRDMSNTPVARTAPFSYTPSPNSSLPREEDSVPNASHPSSTVVHVGVPNGSVIMTNGGSVLTNGKLILENGVNSMKKPDKKPKPKSFLHDQSWISKDSAENKPAAQVSPRRKAHAH